MPDPEVVTPPVETPPPTATPTWRDGLPDDLKADKSLESFKDIGALAKSFIETKKMVGAKQDGMLKVPGADATPEERAAFHKAIGVPPTPAEYKVKPHEIMGHPEWSREAQDAFVTGAHKEGFTPAQLNYAIGWYADFMSKTARDNTRMEGEAKAELRADWGPNYDAYLGAANRAVNDLAAQLNVTREDLHEATKGNDPALVARMFHWVAANLMEHDFAHGTPTVGVTKEEAERKIAEIDAELKKLDPNSERASQLVDQKIAYRRAAMRAA